MTPEQLAALVAEASARFIAAVQLPGLKQTKGPAA